jgi:hypothetical protein
MRVRTTFRPDQEVEVDQAEYEDLKQQGVLLPGLVSEADDATNTDNSGGAPGGTGSTDETEPGTPGGTTRNRS